MKKQAELANSSTGGAEHWADPLTLNTYKRIDKPMTLNTHMFSISISDIVMEQFEDIKIVLPKLKELAEIMQ